MTDNSNNFDSLQERNQQVLNNISQLQTQEKELYANLDDVSLSSEQKQQIINKINEISQMRMNLYAGMKDMYSYYQQNVSASRSTLGQSIAAVDILENELNQSKIKMNLIEDQKYNKLRLIEINTYFGKRYNAHAKLMKTIVLICIPIIILAVLANKGILPPNIYKLLVVIILVIGSLLIGLQLIDMSNRDDMNWDEYNWYFNKKDAPSDTTDGTSSDPWGTVSVTCVGSACCNPDTGSTYDSDKNICVPNAVYKQEHPETIETIETTETESFRGLGKYGYTQLKTSSLNNTILPTFSPLTKFS
jgi:hypothetical protein